MGQRPDPGFEDLESAQAWRDRLIAWRQNLSNALAVDSVPAPAGESRWLLYPPACSAADEAGALKCTLCRACLTALKRKNAHGAPCAEMPVCSRAHGLWGGPEPQELRDLTFIERRVIQLARVYAMVKRVLRKHVPWARDNEAAIPQYTTHNTVAYPNDPGKLLRIICMLPEDLAADFAVQFFGTMEDARQEPALQVSLHRLRSAIWWLCTNCWPWMEQTKYLAVLSRDRLGSYMESVLQKYAESLGGASEGVPRELAQMSTRLDPTCMPQAHAGPADAADSAEDSADRGAFSSAVMDTGLEGCSTLQATDMAMKKYKVIEDCESIINALGDENKTDEKEAALRAETMAIAEAAQAIGRLAAKEVREELEKFVAEEDASAASASLHVHSVTPQKTVGSRVRTALQSFVEQPTGEQLVLRLKHSPQLLSSYDEYFWCHCFVDLFFRGDCREKYPAASKPLASRRWIKVLLGSIHKLSIRRVAGCERATHNETNFVVCFGAAQTNKKQKI